MSLLNKIRRGKFLLKDGVPVTIARPQDPKKALAWAEELIGQEGEKANEAFNQILNSQPYQVIGWASRKKPGVVLGPEGERVGLLQEGDSYITDPRLVPPCFKED